MKLILVSSCSCLCPIHCNQGLSQEWRCSWSSTDCWCSNYIWVINDYIAYKGAAYIRVLTVAYYLFCTKTLPMLTNCQIASRTNFSESWIKILKSFFQKIILGYVYKSLWILLMPKCTRSITQTPDGRNPSVTAWVPCFCSQPPEKVSSLWKILWVVHGFVFYWVLVIVYALVLVTHNTVLHDELMTWKCILHYWPFVRGINRTLVSSLHICGAW